MCRYVKLAIDVTERNDARPKELELPVADELVAIDNLEVLRQNGFEVDVDAVGDGTARRLKLVATPVSKNTEFDEHGRVASLVTS